LETVGEATVSIAEIEAFIPRVMEKAGVTGLSCAIINGSKVAYVRAFGAKDGSSGAANDEETIFAAASFSKTVFAYLVMLLVEEGVLDLDRPLEEYLKRPLPEYPPYADLEGDDRYQRITSRMVLSHSTGFPNWRFLTDDKKLVILFDPGSRHSYSGEGIQLLQMVVEEITGRGLEELSRERVFEPLGMTRTSYVWQEEYEQNHALPHNEFEIPKKLNRRKVAEAAGSMQTTAADYARFLVGILNAGGSREEIVDEMLRPHLPISSRRLFGPGAWEDTDENQAINLSWGLGWGRFDTEQGRAFFHTGHDFGWQNYTVTYADRGVGVVLLSNSDNFESVAREIVERTIGDVHSPFDWLGYVPFDPTKKRVPPPERVAIEVAQDILKEYVGTFELMPGTRILVKEEEGHLYCAQEGEDWDELFAETESSFFVKGEDVLFSFARNAAGEVELTLHVEGLELPAVRVK
jgi:CubicO group peptidase (beta-lactamase class C family)